MNGTTKLPPSLSRGAAQEAVSTNDVYNVISGAASQDPEQVKASTKRLKEMLDMLGIFDSLHEIAAEKTLPLQIRQQSIIQFKNSALSHWKSRKLSNDEQRMRIRARCFTFLDEPDELIANCNKLIVARLARIDYPSNWSNLIPDLMNIIIPHLERRYSSPVENPQETLVLRRALTVINGIIKEFASVKMPSGMKVMAKLVEDLRSNFQNYYTRIFSTFASPSTTAQDLSSPRSYHDILFAHLTFKATIRMAIWIWQRNERLSDIEAQQNAAWLWELFQGSVVHLKTLVELRNKILASVPADVLASEASLQRSMDILTRLVRAHGKFFRRLQQLQNARFVQLPMCADMIMFYWSQVVESTNASPASITDSNLALFPVRFLVQAMVLFKDSLAQWSPVRKDGTPNPNSLSQEFIENAVKLLVTRFVPLNPADLENWMADPEEWVNSESKENDQWEYEIRPCSERLLMQLSNQHSQFVVPLLESTFKQLATQPASSLESVVQKEALYCALGRCANRLKDVIPFDHWLSQTLLPEAQETNANYPIIKRRIAWLIGKWVSDACTPPNNPDIWKILVHLLQDQGQGTDPVVRLTAAMALGECVDTLEFSLDVFTPYLPATVKELVKLTGEAETMETKRRVLHSLNIVIERADTKILPLVNIVTEPLPQLWTAAGDDWLFKASLLVTVTKLVCAVKEQSAALSPIVVPLLRESLSPGAISHLDEDALILWLESLRHTTTIRSVSGSPALIDLFPMAMNMLGSNMDLLGQTLDIVLSYLFVDGAGILQMCGTELFNAFLAAYKSGPVTINIKDMTIALNTLVQLAPAQLWAEGMHASGLFSYLLTYLLDGEKSGILATQLIYLFARMLLSDAQIVMQLLSATAVAQNKPEKELLDGLLDQWWRQFDSMSEPRHRKLTALGIAVLVSTGRPEVLERLPGEIFNLWLDVFGEIKEARTQALSHEEARSDRLLRVFLFTLG
ncbi:hypothetical protein HGRIS_009466 [Hohenbuehelia grisea]|uniref:Importin N-terminal domain-containing protein n=1 Tax=Hohenbuehelia grisea TaxID=104357 RepID=A0ABR3J1E8_9AGAR